MENRFGPCSVMAQVTRIAKEDVIKWETIDGEYANDGVRLWREGNPLEHFDVFPDYEALADIDLNAQKFPNAYNGIPESTFFSAVYAKRAWRVTEVWRGRTAMPNHMVDVVLTDTAVAALTASYRSFEL